VKLGFTFGVLLYLLGAQSAWAKASNMSPVDFITHFYEGYLDNLHAGTSLYLINNPFFSKRAKAEQAKNREECEAKSRGDEPCGFGSDGDLYLDSQHTGPGLMFANSHFVAKARGSNRVDVSFTVWPEESGPQERAIRFVLVREKGEWRVDDLTYGSKGSKENIFLPGESMRNRIRSENTSMARNARDWNEAWTWIKTYVHEPYTERFCRFVVMPVEVCDPGGKCSPVGECGVEMAAVVQSLRAGYLESERTNTTKDEVVRVHPKEGQTLKKGAFTFVFKKSVWSIVKIDERLSKDTF
jgi:hypothetical protein